MIDFSDLKVLVVGDSMLDDYVGGHIRGAATEAPCLVYEPAPMSFEPLALEPLALRVPGGAANCALSLKNLGADVRLVTVIGDDDAGSELSEELVKKSCAFNPIIDDSRQTTVKSRYSVGRQQLFRIDDEKRAPLEGRTLKAVHTKVAHYIAGSDLDAIIISDYGKGVVCPEVIDCITLGREQFKFLAVDPCPEGFSHYPDLDLITPSRAESDRMGCFGFYARQICLTNGEAGMEVYTGNGNTPAWLPATSDNPVCVVGAGDTVIAVMTLLLLKGKSLLEAAEITSMVVGRAVEREYTSFAKLEDFD